jgi:hypothetical protein
MLHIYNCKQQKRWLNKDLILWTCAHKTNTTVHELTCILLLDCKFTLPKYDNNNTKFIWLEGLCNRKLGFKSAAQNSIPSLRKES